jgi:hypothetical protein
MPWAEMGPVFPTTALIYQLMSHHQRFRSPAFGQAAPAPASFIQLLSARQLSYIQSGAKRFRVSKDINRSCKVQTRHA